MPETITGRVASVVLFLEGPRIVLMLTDGRTICAIDEFALRLWAALPPALAGKPLITLIAQPSADGVLYLQEFTLESPAETEERLPQ